MRGVRLRADLARSGTIPAGLDDNQAEAYRADVETARRLSRLLRDRRDKDEGNTTACGATRASIAREDCADGAIRTADGARKLPDPLLPRIRGRHRYPRSRQACLDPKRRSFICSLWTNLMARSPPSCGRPRGGARVGGGGGPCDRRPRPAKPLQLYLERGRILLLRPGTEAAAL